MISARTIELLREERKKLLEAVGHIDSLLEFDGAKPEPDGRTRHDVPSGRPVGRGTKYDWSEGQVMYERGAMFKEIADTLGCSVSAAKSSKRRYGWTRNRKGKRRASVVTCPHCEKATTADPCDKCHTILPKAVANKLAVLMVNNGGRPA